VELPGDDHMPWSGDQDSILDEVQEFVTGIRPSREIDRALATVLFTDIVGSTEHMARVGDKAGNEWLDRHHAIVRRELAAFRGREINVAGDGFFATFDGPARGVRSALSIQEAAHRIGIEIRAGLHTGEVELHGDKVAGIAVHIGARVAALANAGETLVSGTVKDLVSGSGLRFEDRGAHALKGVPGEWRLYAASG
jgi:class 3 adenylate cyclase